MKAMHSRMSPPLGVLPLSRGFFQWQIRKIEVKHVKGNIGTDEQCHEDLYQPPVTILFYSFNAEACALLKHVDHLLSKP